MSAGCTNYGCWIEKPKGMATNGTCRCLDPLDREKAKLIMLQIAKLRRLEALFRDINELVK